MSNKKLDLSVYADEIAYNGANGAIVKIEYADADYKPSKQVCGFIVELRNGAKEVDEHLAKNPNTHSMGITVKLVADDDGKANVSSSTIRKALAYFNRERIANGKTLYEQATLTEGAIVYVSFRPLDFKSCYPVEHVFNVSGGDHCSKKAKTAKADADKASAVSKVAGDSKATVEAVKKADSVVQSDALKAIADARSSTVDFTKIEVKKREEITKFCKSLSDDERAYLLSVLASYKK